MARSIADATKRAREMVEGNHYRYVYGAKGQNYTKALVNSLAKQLPYMYTKSYIAKCMKEADKGFKATDCSGFVCDVLGVSQQGSAQLKAGAVKVLAVKASNTKEGMAIWRNGHIGYVGKKNGELYIFEAQGVDEDMREYKFSQRASHFTYLLIIKGTEKNFETAKKPAPVKKKTNPYKMPLATISYNRKTGITCKGEGAKWVQWELVEAGYKIAIDGLFGPASDAALRSFQKSAKLTVDGKCGPKTKAKLKSN